MASTFTSLETVRRALFTSQMAIQTTGHNISNANTDGYSRQRVNLETTLPYPSVGFNRPQIPGQIGTGVQASTVQRIRDAFVDTQVRQESTKSGYWTAKSDALSKMEDIMNEPTDQGLSTVLNQFWSSLQDLANNPNNSGARSVVRQRGITVANTFNYLSNSLTKVQGDLKTQIGVNIDKINAITSQINQINKQIAEVEPNGYSPNDLYDKRDKLVDELSKYANIKVTTEKTGGNAPATAVGKYTIQLLATDPSTGSQTTFTLVDGKSLRASQMKADFSGATPTLTVDGQAVTNTGGNLQGLVEGYSEDIPKMLDSLDQLAYNMSTEFNKVHQSGQGYDPNGGTAPTNKLFFTDLGTDSKGAASKISISNDIMQSINNIAAAALNAPSGDNTNAQALSDVLSSQTMTFTNQDGDTVQTTLKGFLESAIGQMGVNAQAANTMTTNSQTLQTTAEQRRQSISGVSIDEEMTNLIQYQHSYSAAARMTTVINQMLDTIVNLGK
jgi:flagellar hook-associated protein 1